MFNNGIIGLISKAGINITKAAVILLISNLASMYLKRVTNETIQLVGESYSTVKEQYLARRSI